MGVIVQNLQGAGGTPVTQFSDSFSGIGAFQGDNWAILGCGDSVLSMSNVDAAINLTAGQLVYGTGAGGLGNLRLFMTPFPAINSLAVKQKSILRGVFAQMKYISRATGAGGFFSGVMCYNTAPDNGKGYYYGVDQTGGTFVTRNIDTTEANIAGSLFAVANNDILRLEVIPGSAANTVKAYRNGVLQSTVVDNNALRPAFTGGWYGTFFRYQIDAGAQMNWDDFSGGLL